MVLNGFSAELQEGACPTGSNFSFKSRTSSWKTTGSMFLQSCIRMNQSPNQSLSITTAISTQLELFARLQKTRKRQYLEKIVVALRERKTLVQITSRRNQNQRKTSIFSLIMLIGRMQRPSWLTIVP